MNQPNPRSHQKLSFFEKAGYSAADSAANFVFMTMILFQANFYTDVFGLTASAAAAILLWPRLWDAVADPIVGILADRTDTRWGKFRPWILFTSIRRAVVHRHDPGLHDAARLEHGRHDRLCRDHQHDVDDDLFDEQYALRGAWRRDDGRRK
jgi:MFS/sugar transport protein